MSLSVKNVEVAKFVSVYKNGRSISHNQLQANIFTKYF